ncbi:MAG: hypothetical protein Q4C67_03530 [Deinococcus sp.]|nr:hypothetical protein [Deinococcus sp.]
MLGLWLAVGIRIPTAPTRLSRAAAYALSFACLTAPPSLLFLNFLMSGACAAGALLIAPLLALALFAELAARLVTQAGGQNEAPLLRVLAVLTLVLAAAYVLEPFSAPPPVRSLCAGQAVTGRMGAELGFLAEAAKGVLPPFALLAYAGWRQRRAHQPSRTSEQAV